MAIRLKILNKLIPFFKLIRTNTTNIIEELKFMKYELMFDERDDDIYVATYLKSGTTWMQMILYQLTTPGEMSFKHIYDVSPWLRNLAFTEGPITELPSPRIIKTHDSYTKFAKGKKGRFIFVVREGRDMAYSLYHHYRNYNNAKLTQAENFNLTFREDTDMNWFDFMEEWLQNKNGQNILYIRYEDLKRDLPGQIFGIAAFLGIEIRPEDLSRILERTSFKFMKEHEDKFGERPPEEKQEVIYDQFIRSGQIGEGKDQLSAEDEHFFRENFEKRLSQHPLMQYYDK